MKMATTLLAIAILFAPVSALADDMKDMPGMHDMKDMKATEKPKSASAAAFEAVNMKMHKDMSIEFTGDADIDFVKGMIPHHQGAIDMANVLLKYGKDPETRKLAEGIIKAQESEIAFMKDWLAKLKK